MRIARLIMMILICISYAIIVYLLGIKAKGVKINWKEQMDKLIRTSAEQLKENQKRYNEKQVYLSRMGINYTVGRMVLPEEYFLFKVTLALAMCIFCSVLFGVVGIMIGITSYFLPDMFFTIKNKNDNKHILKEIKSIYDTIQIKTQGGMFLTSAIVECYKNTRNRRLKKALYEMSGQIIAKNDLSETIDAFNLKFKNKYIDNLCIILKQALDSGKTVEIMQSIQDQLADMQDAVNLQIKNRLSTKVTVIMLLIFAVTMVFAVAGSFIAINSDLVNGF